MTEKQTDIAIAVAVEEKGYSLKVTSRFVSSLDRLFAGFVDVISVRVDRANKKYSAVTANELKLIKSGKHIESTVIPKQITSELSSSRDQERKYLNRANIAMKTAEVILEGANPETDSQIDETIDDDWMNSFVDYAEKASSDNRQEMWAKVLAREIRNPGSFSMHTLRIISETDRKTAEIFTSHAKYRLNDVFLKPPKLAGQELSDLVSLEVAGLVSGVNGSLGVPIDARDDAGNAALIMHPYAIRFMGISDTHLRAIILTASGKEICEILPQPDPLDVLRKVAEFSSHHRVVLSRIVERPPNIWGFVDLGDAKSMPLNPIS